MSRLGHCFRGRSTNIYARDVPRLSPQQYEKWFVDVVASICARIAPDAVAIFYQTDGRHSGVDGAWLDKGYLCTAGARAAGAACVWHRVVNASTPMCLSNAGRAGFVHLQCFSRAHRCTAAQFPAVARIARARRARTRATRTPSPHRPV